MESTPFFPSPRSRRRRRYSEEAQHWHTTAPTGWPEPAPLLARRYPTPALHTTGADAPAATGWQDAVPADAAGDVGGDVPSSSPRRRHQRRKRRGPVLLQARAYSRRCRKPGQGGCYRHTWGRGINSRQRQLRTWN